MRIENLRKEQLGQTARVAATVIWEDCEQRTRDIYFETKATFADSLTCAPEAFLVACFTPAMRHGEKRLWIDGAIQPELSDGLANITALFRQWYGEPSRAIRIESRPAEGRLPARSTERTASFLSGGIDSLATLRRNRLNFSLNHPHSIQDCLFVHGFDMGGVETIGAEKEVVERALAALADVVQEAQVTLIPVSTNIRHLDSDVEFWIHEFHGAALAAVAHALSSRLNLVLIPSSDTDLGRFPLGSHPLLDPSYSSATLQIRHDGWRFTRLDKVQIVAGWKTALRNLRVCTMNPAGRLNCGSCEKCIRTMTELLAVDCLAQTTAFPLQDVSAALLDNITIKSEDIERLYLELIEPLKARGRPDLVEVIEAKSQEFKKHLAWEREQDWKGAIKKFDRRCLRGNIYCAYKRTRQRFMHN